MAKGTINSYCQIFCQILYQQSKNTYYACFLHEYYIYRYSDNVKYVQDEEPFESSIMSTFQGIDKYKLFNRISKHSNMC